MFRDRYYVFKNSFAQNAFLLFKTLLVFENLDHIHWFLKKTQFFRQKLAKIVNIYVTLAPDWRLQNRLHQVPRGVRKRLRTRLQLQQIHEP
jgi:hypothetical protein